MPSPNLCPDAGELRKLIDGSAAPEEQAALAAHLDGCPDCQAALEGLGGGQDSWGDAARYLASAFTADPALANAMNHLEADSGKLETAAEVKADGTGGLEFLDPPERPGQLGKLADYEILEIVGRGGMGIVLKAFDPKLHRVVAVKVMNPQHAGHPIGRQRFRREAQAAAAVTHDHIVTIHAVEEAKGLPYLVMQFIAGRSLQERIDQGGALELKEILRIGMQAASGLAAAHAQGLVHRDIKPANILLENGIERVKITDFGLARAVDDARVTQSGVVTGTPQYMSPEQAGGKTVDHRADLFSLGGVLYAMCTGYAPFRASSSMAVLKKVCDEAPRPIRDLNAEIPDWLSAIVEKLMAKDPKDRFGSATEVAALLGQHLAHLQQPAVFPQPPDLPRPVAKLRRSHSRVGLIVAIVVALALLPCLAAAGGLLVMVLLYYRAPSPSGPVLSAEAREYPDSEFSTRGGTIDRGMVRLQPDAPETVLKKFDPKVDKAMTKEALGYQVAEEEGGWRVEHQTELVLRPAIREASSVRLFEITRPSVRGCRITLRAKMKTHGKDAYNEACLEIDGGVAVLGSVREGSTNWAPYEISWKCPWDATPESLKVNARIVGNGSIWIKDLELVTTPLPDPPGAPASGAKGDPQPTTEVVLKKFDPKTDKAFQTEIGDRFVTVEGDSWRIEAKKPAPSPPPGGAIPKPIIRLFEVPKQNVKDSTVVLHFKMKTERVTDYADIDLVIGNMLVDSTARSLGGRIRGTTDWKSYELRHDCKDSSPVDIIISADVGGTGTMWLKDVEVVRVKSEAK